MKNLKNTRSNLLALGVKLNLLAEQRLLEEMESLEEDLGKRFWLNVKRGKENECWEWTGSRVPDGYGQFRLFNRRVKPHRISYILKNGKIIGRKFACHSCDNKSCVNPNHIWIGTNEDNQKDAVKKGRNYNPRGELAPWAKLKSEDVFMIRKLCSDGICERRIAEKFNISFQQVNKIKLRLRWSHI